MFNGRLIYYLRKQRGYSQDDLAKVFDVTRGTVCNWEIGRRTPSTKQFIDIADYFGVSLDLFVERSTLGASKEILIQIDAFFNDLEISEKEKKRLFENIKKLFEEKKEK